MSVILSFLNTYSVFFRYIAWEIMLNNVKKWFQTMILIRWNHGAMNREEEIWQCSAVESVDVEKRILFPSPAPTIFDFDRYESNQQSAVQDAAKYGASLKGEETASNNVIYDASIYCILLGWNPLRSFMFFNPAIPQTAIFNDVLNFTYFRKKKYD